MVNPPFSGFVFFSKKDFVEPDFSGFTSSLLPRVHIHNPFPLLRLSSRLPLLDFRHIQLLSPLPCGSVHRVGI